MSVVIREQPALVSFNMVFLEESKSGVSDLQVSRHKIEGQATPGPCDWAHDCNTHHIQSQRVPLAIRLTGKQPSLASNFSNGRTRFRDDNDMTEAFKPCFTLECFESMGTFSCPLLLPDTLKAVLFCVLVYIGKQLIKLSDSCTPDGSFRDNQKFDDHMGSLNQASSDKIDACIRYRPWRWVKIQEVEKDGRHRGEDAMGSNESNDGKLSRRVDFSTSPKTDHGDASDFQSVAHNTGGREIFLRLQVLIWIDFLFGMLDQKTRKWKLFSRESGCSRMKVGLAGLKGKEISLISIVLMSATIILWSWEKMPGLSTFLPPQTPPLQLSSDHLVSSRSAQVLEPDPRLGEEDGSSLAKKKTTNKPEELHLQGTSQTVPAQSSFGNNMDEDGSLLAREKIANEAEELHLEETLQTVPAQSSAGKSTAEDDSSLSKKKNANEPEELHLEGASQAVPSQNSSGMNMGESNTRTISDTKKIPSSVSDDEAKHKRILEDEKNHDVQTSSGPTTSGAKRNEAEGEKSLKQEDKHKNDFVTNSSPISSLTNGKDNNRNNPTESKVCNYAKGKWVPDNNRPLYSGFGCKQWLSGMWACRLMQRTDFEYEKLRWQPKDCHMEEFEGSKFLRRMQHKTLAFVGDSLGRQQFQSLMCMITGGEKKLDVEDVGKEYGLVIAGGSARPNGWAFRFPSTNTTILYYWSASLCDVEPIDVNNEQTDYAMHLDRPPAFLRQYLHKFNVLVLNTGHHWNRGKLTTNRWVMHVGGVPNTDRKIAVIWGAKNLTIHSVVSWVNSQLPKYPGLKVFFRTISPRHFVGGDWNTGGSCDNTKPMSVGKVILGEESSDENAAHAVKGTEVKLLDITALSQLRDEAHISRFSITAKPGVQDCLHWCLPGVPDTWNEILFAQI
ncbi:hypothetical protein VNO78_23086 [Psophocarpus tetragonolobus]|uniref:Trichome birefringence-like N-terminal domain-containing protein n=1 Tax=Psophocarpus tetragonolobus TaxID=3891 RepID=A0AAN9XCW5_PSOTE